MSSFKATVLKTNLNLFHFGYRSPLSWAERMCSELLLNRWRYNFIWLNKTSDQYQIVRCLLKIFIFFFFLFPKLRRFQTRLEILMNTLPSYEDHRKWWKSQSKSSSIQGRKKKEVIEMSECIWWFTLVFW